MGSYAQAVSNPCPDSGPIAYSCGKKDTPVYSFKVVQQLSDWRSYIEYAGGNVDVREQGVLEDTRCCGAAKYLIDDLSHHVQDPDTRRNTCPAWSSAHHTSISNE